MSRFLSRKAALSAGVAVVVLVAAGGAYAYWTNGGSGTGSAATGTNVAIAVTQTSTPTALYPGGPTASLAGAFNNTNASPVRVHQVSATISSVTLAAASAQNASSAGHSTAGSAMRCAATARTRSICRPTEGF